LGRRPRHELVDPVGRVVVDEPGQDVGEIDDKDEIGELIARWIAENHPIRDFWV
jgi:hypothetical protein